MQFPELKGRFVLAPMSGVTDVAFRVLCKRLGAAMTYTEFTSADGIVQGNQATRDRFYLAQEEDPVGVQLFDDAEAEEFTLLIGPKDLPVSHGHEGHAHYGTLPEPQQVRIPKDVYLTGFRYDIVDAAGNGVPTEVLHHMYVVNPEKRELFLPIAQRMLAVGKETGARSMPGWLIGYPVEEGTEPIINVMLHNPTSEPIDGVMVRLVLEYEDADGVFPLYDIYPFQVDVSFPAGDKQFDLPPGRSTFSWTGSPALEGRIMMIGSHLHEHADTIRLVDVTDGDLVWEGYPVENEQGELETVTVGELYWELGEPLDPSHRYRATVVYNNPTNDTLSGGGMGVVAGAFMPEAETWPEADTTDPLYRLDRRHFLRQVSGTYEQLTSDSLRASTSAETSHHVHAH